MKRGPAMKRILITGHRPEITKLFELLMQKQDRQFVSAKSLTQCFDLAIKTVPALIIIDCAMAGLRQTHETVVAVKGSSKTSGIPILLIDDPQQEDEGAGELLNIVNGAFSEPFNPVEIKKTAEKYL
jgi:CheY-like chemotaxis protein